MTAPLWQSEFPNYEPADMPIIPASWNDTSWHNDVCPSFDTGKGLSVFVDYADPAAREMECERFTVSEIGPDGCHLVENQGALLATDDWQAVLDFVAAYVPPAKAEAPAPVIPQAGNLDALTAELNAYCAEHGLKPRSADEMAAEHRAHAEWFWDFCNRWHEEEARIELERGPAWSDDFASQPDAVARLAAAFLDHQPEFLRIPTQWSEGKPRNLDYARSAAVWPDATDAELMQEPEALKAVLEARHASLMAEFKAAILGAGLLWDAR